MYDKFFTSDLHFGHEAILRHTERGLHWGNIEDHDRDVVRIINETAMADSELYIIGDLAMGNKWKAAEHVSKLAARRKHLVLGNHDEDLGDFWCQTGLFDSVKLRLKFKHHDKFLVLDHHPSLEWDRCHYGAWMLHGHTHGDLVLQDFNMEKYRIFDVGFDASRKFDTGYGFNPMNHAYKPFSFTWLQSYMDDKIKLEHHGACNDRR